MKKPAALAILLLTAATALSGCSFGSKTKIEVFSAKMENKDTLQKMVDGYTALHPEVEIELNSPPEGGTVLRTKLTKNRVPDIMFLGGDNVYTDLQDAGILRDLSEEASAAQIKEAYQEQVYRLNGDKSKKLYGIPYATNGEGVIYNKDIFREHGIEVPKTYDELLAVCVKLREEGVTPFYFTLKDNWTAACLWNAMAGNVISEEFSDLRLAGETAFLGTHEALVQQIMELTTYGQEDIMGMGYDDGNMAFANGKAAMMVQGNWAIPNIKKSNPDVNLDMFTLPVSNVTEDNKVISGIDVMVTVSATTKHWDVVQDFLNYINEPANIQTYINDQFAFAAAKGIDQPDQTVAGLAEDFREGKIAEFADHYYPVGFSIGELLQGYIGNPGDLSQFLQKMDKTYDKYNK